MSPSESVGNSVSLITTLHGLHEIRECISSQVMSHNRLYYHIVFSTYRREATINPCCERQLYAYLCRVSENKGVTVIQVNSMPDHVHLLVRGTADLLLEDYVRDLKRSSSIMLKRTSGFETFNRWGKSFSVDTVSFHAVEMVRAYVRNQKEHHKTQSFYDEMRSMFGMEDPNLITE